mmetsp:Transcript_25903/g.41692  ORF Transcript_25903/g.41692 Transcript_25903/m.41692 type:complete len:208 (-) Transcript_25903:228-851(-)
MMTTAMFVEVDVVKIQDHVLNEAHSHHARDIILQRHDVLPMDCIQNQPYQSKGPVYERHCAEERNEVVKCSRKIAVGVHPYGAALKLDIKARQPRVAIRHHQYVWPRLRYPKFRVFRVRGSCSFVGLENDLLRFDILVEYDHAIDEIFIADVIIDLLRQLARATKVMFLIVRVADFERVILDCGKFYLSFILHVSSIIDNFALEIQL